MPHDTFKDVSFSASYSMVYNLLDLPCGVVPMTLVDKEKDHWPEPSPGPDGYAVPWPPLCPPILPCCTPFCAACQADD